MDLEQIRSSYFELVEKLRREYLANRRGLQDTVNSTALYKHYDWTYSLDSITVVKVELDKATGDRKRQLLFLLRALTNAHIDAQLAPFSDELTSLSAKATITWDGKDIPLRSVDNILKNEPDQKRRAALHAACATWRELFSKKHADLWAKNDALCKTLGYNGYLDLNERLKQLRYEPLLKTARQLLVGTQQEHAMMLARETKNAGITTLHRYDMSYLLNDPTTKDKFPAERLIPFLRAFLKDFHTDFDTQTNITWDTESRSKKAPRACVFAIKPPHEIYVLTSPTAGMEDARTLFHEAGHAEHYAHTDASLPDEFKLFGLNSTTETWSYLFDHLFFNDEFLKTHTNLTPPEITRTKEHRLFNELCFIRRYAAKCLYEHKFFTNDLRKLDERWEPTNDTYRDMGACYADILTRATGSIYEPIGYPTDIDPGFYTFEYFKAWMSEAQVRTHLEKIAGKTWWKTKKTIDIVKKLWSTGGKLNVDEITQSLGYPGLRVDELLIALKV